jgi:hypothetical protein
MAKRYVVRRSFVGRLAGVVYRCAEGETVTLPEGSGWVACGFLRPLDEETAESAQAQQRETRASKRSRK